MRALLLATVGLLSLVVVPPASAQDTPQDTTAERPIFTRYTKGPEIKNRREAARILERHYPNEFKDHGVGGTALVWVFIDTDGRVKNTQISRSSGVKGLDEAAMAAVREFEFIPARNEGEVCPVWVAIPITFAVRR
jgi:protein TonB